MGNGQIPVGGISGFENPGVVVVGRRGLPLLTPGDPLETVCFFPLQL